ncbi:MAG TPA: papain-like cysteine protease family protein [Acetobacteraceae bacterium]|nr:papain-like cysteine protease family protein [Acetobacteraceae bacterium]
MPPVILNHPRGSVMNHQPEGPTCWVSCVVAVVEYYKNALMPNKNGLSPVQYMEADFMKWHASATTSPNYLKHALSLEGHYEGEQKLLSTDAAQTIFTTVTNEINAQRPLLFGVHRTGATYGHALMVYGYNLPNTCYIADPIIGQLTQTIDLLKHGYNGYPAYHWIKLWRTKP